MKVYRKEPEPKPEPFKPVIIELETKEEYNDFWHILNYAEASSLTEYCLDKGIPLLIGRGYFTALDRIER